MFEENGVELEKEIQAELPLMVADRGALERALHNLLSNAVKYGGGSKGSGLKSRVSINVG